MRNVTLMRVATLLVLSMLVMGCAQQAPPPADTPEARAEIAGAIAKMEVEGGSYDQTLDLGAEFGLSSSEAALRELLGRDLTDEDTAKAKKVIRDSLAEIVSVEAFTKAVADAYAEHFTAAELQSISEFFSSPGGAKLLREHASMTNGIGDATEALVEANLVQFTESVDAGLAAEFAEPAEGGTE